MIQPIGQAAALCGLSTLMENMTLSNEPINLANCFKLIAACFYQPDKRLFTEEQVCENLNSLFEGAVPEGAAAALKMRVSLDIYTQEQLEVDHAALFLGPFELIAPPYGSVYMENRRQVMEESTMKVLKFYEQAGVKVNVSEPPDHIALELEFMHHLLLREAELVSDSNSEESNNLKKLQCEFFNESLLWSFKLCDAIIGGTKNTFYINLAHCLRSFLEFCTTNFKPEKPDST